MNPRALVGAITISVVVAMMQKPEPIPPPIVVPYCIIDMRAAVKTPRGWRSEWSQSYGPCYLQDRFVNT